MCFVCVDCCFLFGCFWFWGISCCVVRWFVSVDGKWCLDKVRGCYLFICRNDEVGVLDCGVGFVCINWHYLFLMWSI